MHKVLFLTCALSASASAFAESEFCQGFAEGYHLMRGDMATVPVCPTELVTPTDSNPFREGIKAGLKAAEKEPQNV